jgi:hypothetical protein
MATLNVVAINNEVPSVAGVPTSPLAKQFNYDQVVFGPVAYVPANNRPSFATGLAMFTYDEGLGRPTKYIVSDTLSNTKAYFLAAGSLLTTAIPTSADVPSIGVGTSTTPVTEIAVVENAAFVANIETATNKTLEDKGSIAGLFKAANTAATAHASVESIRAITVTHAACFAAIGVRGSVEVHDALATDKSNGIVSAVYGVATLTAAVTQGWVTAGHFAVTGAGAVTELNHGIAVTSAASVTSLDAMVYLNNAGNAGNGITLVGTYGTGILLSAATTGISLAGACTTGVLIGGATTTAISITGNATTALEVKTGTFATGISLAGTLTTGVSIGACTTGVTITGAATTGYLANGATTSAFKTGAGAVTNVIEVGTAATTTNLIKFNAVGGCLVAKDVVPAAAPDASQLGADACLTILVNATPYYIPLYNTQHA